MNPSRCNKSVCGGGKVECAVSKRASRRCSQVLTAADTVKKGQIEREGTRRKSRRKKPSGKGGGCLPVRKRPKLSQPTERKNWAGGDQKELWAGRNIERKTKPCKWELRVPKPAWIQQRRWA